MTHMRLKKIKKNPCGRRAHVKQSKQSMHLVTHGTHSFIHNVWLNLKRQKTRHEVHTGLQIEICMLVMF